MQYVRSLSGSVSKTWNSINPATLSGAIDVVVIEQEDGMSVYPRRFTGADVERRNSRLFALPRSIRQVLPASAVRKEGTLSLLRCEVFH